MSVQEREYERAQIARRKEQYPSGTRIELVFMGDDPAGVARGTLGTVESVDDAGAIHPRWDDGRTLGVVLEDRVRIVKAGA